MKHTYYIIKGKFGHMGLARRINNNSSNRIAGEKPWGGGSIIKSFRSRSDNAAIKRFNKGT